MMTIKKATEPFNKGLVTSPGAAGRAKPVTKFPMLTSDRHLLSQKKSLITQAETAILKPEAVQMELFEMLRKEGEKALYSVNTFDEYKALSNLSPGAKGLILFLKSEMTPDWITGAKGNNDTVYYVMTAERKARYFNKLHPGKDYGDRNPERNKERKVFEAGLKKHIAEIKKPEMAFGYTDKKTHKRITYSGHIFGMNITIEDMDTGNAEYIVGVNRFYAESCVKHGIIHRIPDTAFRFFVDSERVATEIILYISNHMNDTRNYKKDSRGNYILDDTGNYILNPIIMKTLRNHCKSLPQKNEVKNREYKQRIKTPIINALRDVAAAKAIISELYLNNEKILPATAAEKDIDVFDEIRIDNLSFPGVTLRKPRARVEKKKTAGNAPPNLFDTDVEVGDGFPPPEPAPDTPGEA